MRLSVSISPRRRRGMPIALNFAATIAFVLACAAGSVRGDDPKNTTVPSDPVFEATLADGSVVSGRLLGFGPAQSLVLVGDAGEKSVVLSRLVSLTRQGDPPPYPPEGTVVVLPDGDRLSASIQSSGEQAVEVQPKALGEAKASVPLSSVLGLLLIPDSDAAKQDEWLRRLRAEPRDGDVAWLANGDRVVGALLGLDARKVRVQRDGADVELDRAGVVAVGFDPALAAYPKPEGLYFELTSRDGSRLGVSDCKLEKGRLVATARFGAALEIPLTEVSRLVARSPSIVYLSEQTEIAKKSVGYLGESDLPLGKDTTFDGQTALHLGGRFYDHGLGMIPRTEVTYKLDASDKRFQSLVGLDDRAGARGSVVFRVLVDGEEKFATPAMTIRDAPRLIDVVVGGGKRLTLVTDAGEGGYVQDIADWVEPRLIR